MDYGKEIGRVCNWQSGKYTCACGEIVELHFNGGELDSHYCKCGRIYMTEHVQIDLVIYEGDLNP